MRIAVVGGCRFIGVETASTLERSGHEVVVVDDRPCPEGYRPRRLLDGWPGDPGVLGDALQGARVAYFFHEMDGVVECIRDPAGCWRENVEAANSFLMAALESETVERIVYASTAAVYGEQQRVPHDEDVPLNPVNWYGATRLAGETLARGLATERGIRLVVLRYFNVYGPGEWNRGNPGVVYRMLTSAISGGYVRIEGDGMQSRDFVHVADAVRAAEAALTGRPGVYNISWGVPVRIAELARLIAEIHGEPLDVVWAPERPGDVKASSGDPGRAARSLGWKPLVPLPEGIRHLYRLYSTSTPGKR